jgi:hypothetical protein
MESFLLIPTLAQVGKRQKLWLENGNPRGHMFMLIKISEHGDWATIPISIFSEDD